MTTAQLAAVLFFKHLEALSIQKLMPQPVFGSDLQQAVSRRQLFSLPEDMELEVSSLLY
jgi:hypothetical protein